MRIIKTLFSLLGVLLILALLVVARLEINLKL